MRLGQDYYPIRPGTKVNRGDTIGLDEDGYALPTVLMKNPNFMGVSTEDVDNRSDRDGRVLVDVGRIGADIGERGV